MPGFGDTNWRDIISILRSNGYEDDICIEGYHDPVYNGELEMTGQLHALNYLNGAEAESSHQSVGEIIQIYRDRKKQEGIPMKLGFVTAILDSWTYEEMMDLRLSRD